ncbi:MarR family winged helix-turn-helix transcriptional regulator [Oceanobacillus timonensis]|uniref:MarR family winged helix-turn-helix transcriptional regulator n=1 Tax=Oceanobacillus timonensis TaxID=1926285 RepID=UPI0009BB59A1|nr:MarR family transcriptional regulator [Oceanobacillus timonensis]
MKETLFFELIHNTELFSDKMMTLFMKKFNRNISISQIVFLWKLNEKESEKLSVMAKEIGYTSGAITGITSKLVEKGYIKRKPQENDRRVILITITEKGKELLDEAQQRGQDVLNEVYTALDEEEIVQLLRIKKKLIHQVQQLN